MPSADSEFLGTASAHSSTAVLPRALSESTAPISANPSAAAGSPLTASAEIHSIASPT